MASLAQKTDVDISKALASIKVKVVVHKLKRTVVRAMIADYLLRLVRVVAPWDIRIEESAKKPDDLPRRTYRQWQKDVCEALGFDANGISRLTLDLTADGLPEIEVYAYQLDFDSEMPPPPQKFRLVADEDGE